MDSKLKIIGTESPTAKKLQLNLPSLTLDGVLDFDNNIEITVLSEDSDVWLIPIQLEFKMFLDVDSGFHHALFSSFPATSDNSYLTVVLYDSSLYVKTYTGSQKAASIKEFNNQIIDVKIIKDTNTFTDPSIYFNNIDVGAYTDIIYILSRNGGTILGGGIDLCNFGGSNVTMRKLENGTIWDVKITDLTTNTLIHSWDGYPAGNTSSAWLDNVGSYDGTLLGSAGTRDILAFSGPGNVLTSSRKLFLGKFIEAPLFSFITDASVTTFAPEIGVSAGILRWDLGDASSNVSSNKISHTYASTGNKIVKVYPGTTSGALSITSIERFTDDNIVGTLNLSTLSNLGGSCRLYGNPKLTEIINPTSSQTFIQYTAQNNNLTGTLDLSSLSGLGGSVDLGANKNLTSVLFPTSSVVFSELSIDDCSLNGTLDISGLSKLGGSLNLNNNKNLTSVLFPTSTQAISNLSVSNTGIIGTLDISGLTNLSGYITFNTNPGLTSILLPPSSGSITTGIYLSNCNLTGFIDASGLTVNGTFHIGGNPNLTNFIPPKNGVISTIYSTGNNGLASVNFSESNFKDNFYVYSCSNLTNITLPTLAYEFRYVYVNDCSLSQTCVDDILSKLNTWYSSNPPTKALGLTFAGGTNSPPTGGMSNTDITDLQTIFTNASQTLTININT